MELASAAVEAKGHAQQANVSSVARSNDQQKVEGEAAVKLVEAAGDAGAKSNDGHGTNLDLFA